jgi:hypothetical protein
MEARMLQDQPANLELAPLSAGERSHWLEDALLVSEWLEDLCMAASEMDSLWWWRLGGRLRLARAGPGGPLRQVAGWREEAVLLQRELLGRLETGTLDRNAAQAGLARLTEMVPAMHREILRASGSPWWRTGLALRRLSGALGLKKPGFRMSTEDAAAVMARFRRWKILPESGCAGRGVSPAAPPPNAWKKSRFHERVLPLAERGEWPAFGAAFRMSEQRLAAARRELPGSGGPLVSVIMAAWNRAEVVAEAVHSVMDQTWPHWELIVCDDGSDDGTADAACAAGDGRVRALRLTHGGAALARNRGLFEAHGEYIAYLDTDNLWHPAYLETMVRTLEECRGRWCAFARYVDAKVERGGGLRLRSARALEFSYERLSEKNYIDLNTFFHRAELFRLFGGFTESLPRSQDWDLALKYCFAQDPVYVNRYLALYRRNTAWGQLTDTQRALDGFTESAVAEQLRCHYAGGLAGPGRGGKRRVTVISCDLRPDEPLRGKALAAALRETGFEVQELCIAAAVLDGPPPWNLRKHLGKILGGMVLCVGALPQTIELGLAVSEEHGEGVVLDLTGADVDDKGVPARAADKVAVWTTGNPRVDRLLGGRATFLGGYEGEGVVDGGPDARRVLWAGRLDGSARPSPAELALRVDLPEHVIMDTPTDRWSAALFWPVTIPAPGYRVDPFVLARAFAAGAPVILGDPNGPDDLARQEVVRWVNPEDDESLRDAIDEALERRGAARERAANARRLFQRQYGVRAAAAQFAVVWERAMAEAEKGNSPTAGKRRGK